MNIKDRIKNLFAKPLTPPSAKPSRLARLFAPVGSLAAVWADEMKAIVRDEGALMFMILVPLLYPLLYSWLYNNEVVRDVPVVVVDKSHSAASRQFIRKVDASPDTRVAFYATSLDEARQLIGRQKAYGAILFPTDFDSRLSRGEQAHVSVYCPMSLMLTYKAVYQTSLAVATDMNTAIQVASNPLDITAREEELTVHPLEVKEVPVFNPTGGYGNSLLPGVLIVIIQQTLLLGIGLAAGTARERNRNQNLIPISRHYDGVLRIVGGKALAYLMLYAVITAYLTVIVPRMFRFTAIAHFHELMALMLPYLLSCIFFGMTLSCLVRYRENVMLLVVFTSVIFLFLTGISWPESAIPPQWKSISWLFPSTFGVQGYLKLSSMGAPLTTAAPEYKALWLQTLAYFLTTCIVYRFQLHKVRKAKA